MTATDRNEQNNTRAGGLPRELAVAAIALVVVMVMTGVALWIVAGSAGNAHGQPQATTVEQTPTADLLQILADDLGPTSTKADLENAVDGWLRQQQGNPGVQLASLAPAR